MPPRLAIISVTYNSEAVLPDFLESLLSQKWRDFVLVVVDNASTDTSVAKIETASGIPFRIIRNPDNVGFAAATNQGIRVAIDRSIEWVLILNNDTAFDPDFLGRLMARAEVGDAEVIAPRVTYADDPARNWYAGGHFSMAWGFRATLEGEGLPEPPSPHLERRVEFAPGCCKLVRTALLERHGLYDERYFVYWEDTDLCWRWRQHGVSILYLPDPVLRHKVSTLTGGERSPFSILMYHKNQILFFRKHFPTYSAVLRTALAVTKVLARLLTGRDSAAQTVARLSAIRQGIAN